MTIEKATYQDTAQTSKEEGQKPVSVYIDKIKQILLGLKKPKFITLGILLATALVIILTLSLMSSKNENVSSPTEFPTLSPIPSPSQEPSLENIAQRVKNYNDQLESRQTYQNRLPYPIVDLDINFDK